MRPIAQISCFRWLSTCARSLALRLIPCAGRAEINAARVNDANSRIQYAAPTDLQALNMRDSTLRSSGGFLIQCNHSLDHETNTSPGHNTFETTDPGPAILYGSPDGPLTHVVYLVGNTWKPSVQGADVAGHYPSMLVTTPTTAGNEGNYSVRSIGPGGGFQF